MCEALGHRVVRLKRVRIMQLELDVPPGKWRHLTEAEVKRLWGRANDAHVAEFRYFALSIEQATFCKCGLFYVQTLKHHS